MHLENYNLELQEKVEFLQSTNSTNLQEEGHEFCPEMCMLVYDAIVKLP